MTREIPGLPHRFQDPRLLEEALTHRSKGRRNNERLEFLGDSVLNFVVSSRLYELRPDASEGDLSRMRARIVRGDSLARLATQLQLGERIRLGEGELKSGGFRRASILADALEALLGAVYLDAGFDACREVIQHLCDPLIRALPDAETLKDPKTRLQEWLQARGRALPEYRLVAEAGADHAKQFTVECRLPDGKRQQRADGSSRRKAEQAAAAAMLEDLQRGD